VAEDDWVPSAEALAGIIAASVQATPLTVTVSGNKLKLSAATVRSTANETTTTIAPAASSENVWLFVAIGLGAGIGAVLLFLLICCAVKHDKRMKFNKTDALGYSGRPVLSDPRVLHNRYDRQEQQDEMPMAMAGRQSWQLMNENPSSGGWTNEETDLGAVANIRDFTNQNVEHKHLQSPSHFASHARESRQQQMQRSPSHYYPSNRPPAARSFHGGGHAFPMSKQAGGEWDHSWGHQGKARRSTQMSPQQYMVDHQLARAQAQQQGQRRMSNVSNYSQPMGYNPHNAHQSSSYAPPRDY
jgi:hypothetical protein